MHLKPKTIALSDSCLATRSPSPTPILEVRVPMNQRRTTMPTSRNTQQNTNQRNTLQITPQKSITQNTQQRNTLQTSIPHRTGSEDLSPGTMGQHAPTNTPMIGRSLPILTMPNYVNKLKKCLSDRQENTYNNDS